MIMKNHIYYATNQECFVRVVNPSYDKYTCAVVDVHGNTFEVFKNTLRDNFDGYLIYTHGFELLICSICKMRTRSLCIDIVREIVMKFNEPSWILDRIEAGDKFSEGLIDDVRRHIVYAHMTMDDKCVHIIYGRSECHIPFCTDLDKYLVSPY